MKASIDYGAGVDIYHVSALEFANANIVKAGPEGQSGRGAIHCVRRGRRNLRPSSVRKHVKVVVVAVELNRIASRADDVERHSAPIAAKCDIPRERTYLHVLEIARRRNCNGRLALEREANHAAKLCLLDLTLMSGPTAIERDRRTTHLRNRHRRAIDRNLIAGIYPLAIRNGIDLCCDERVRCRKKRENRTGRSRNQLYGIHVLLPS